MHPDTLSRRTVAFVNIAHALDHFVLLIYPTAVIAIAAERGLDYSALIGLATGAFVAFGLFSLPMGWLSKRLGRRNLLAAFFGGCGVACLGISMTATETGFAVWLFVLGVFSAIYHPIGGAMLVTHARQLGRDLGWNGVWGNLGAASASGVTAVVAATLGWQAAFAVPGLVCLAVGAAFLALVPEDGEGNAQRKGSAGVIPVSRPMVLMGIFAFAIIAGGVTFNVTTISLPKVIDERLGLALPLAGSARPFVIVGLTYLVSLGELAHIIAGSVEVALAAFAGAVTWDEYVTGFLLPTLAGNVVGGVGLVALLAHAQVREEGS
jgi:MFS family permease